MRLAGKVAIISGAASGMGAATARLFAREGAKVVIADVLEHEGRQIADAIGASARFEPLDVTKEESWAAVVAATTRHFGKLDVLVNNAGISGSAEQDFYSTEAWHPCGSRPARHPRPADRPGHCVDAVPEPGTLLLVLTGLAGAMWVRVRRRTCIR